MSEQWLQISEAPRYWVSDQGHVWSMIKRDLLILTPSTHGYLIVSLRVDGKTLKRSVHRIVLSAFAGAAPAGMDCCHRNGMKVDNQLSNLHWGTRSQNILDEVRHGTHNNARKTRCPQGHSYSPENTYILSRGRRQCKTCTIAQSAARYLNKKKDVA